jgi:hypothetical protein
LRYHLRYQWIRPRFGPWFGGFSLNDKELLGRCPRAPSPRRRTTSQRYGKLALRSQSSIRIEWGGGTVDYKWTCSCCGQTFDTLCMNYFVPAPRNWFAIPETERASRAQLSADLCTIDGVEHYVRGCVEVPVIDCDEPLVWNVWASVSEESLRHILDQWGASVIENEQPRFGWLCTWLQGYPEPREVRCHVHMHSANLRPRIVLEPTDYPLAVEQRTGISLSRVKEIAAAAGHPV